MIEFIQKVDNNVYENIFNIQSPLITNTMILITSLVSVYFMAILMLCILAMLKNKKQAIYIILNLFLPLIICHLLKVIFARTRPEVIALVKENGYSFPSAHAFVGIAFYGFLIYLLMLKIKNKTLKIIVSAIMNIMIVLIGISRIYLGVHYFTDVVGGLILGLIYLLIYIKFIYLKEIKTKKEEINKKNK